MTAFLKQSTAVTLKIGPFLDATDGSTAETALTITQADVRLSKNGGDIAQKNDATSATHDELGYYDVPLNTTDTNTLGILMLAIHEAGALPVWQDYMVVPANVWDSLFGADELIVEVSSTSRAAVADAILDEAFTEPTTVFSWGEATLRTVIAWLGALSRNKMTQTVTTSSLRNDGDSSDIAASTVEDDGTTFTRGEWS